MDEVKLTGARDIPEAEPAAARGGAPLPPGDERIRGELDRIRAMDPEMTDLGAILDSDAGDSFRKYVNMGLSFVDAYTLAARERLQELRDRRTAEKTRGRGGKEHLSATSTRGQGGVSVPGGEMAIIRALVPDATDEEIRRYYSQDKKRFGK